MGERSQTGEWCLPTHEISGSQLVHLLDKSRKRESAPRLDWIHDEPTRRTGAMEALARGMRPVASWKPVKLPSFAPSDSDIDTAMAHLGSHYAEDEPTPLPPPPVVVSTDDVDVDVDVLFDDEPAVVATMDVVPERVAEPQKLGRRAIVILVLLGVLGGIAASFYV